MAVTGARRFIWPGGEHDFALPLGAILAVEQKCGAGISAIMLRLKTQTYGVNDVREPIFQGLMHGSGLSATEAMALVNVHVDQHPKGLGPLALLAFHVLNTVITGVPEDDPLPKSPAPEASIGRPSSMMPAASGAPRSTGSARPSDSRPEMSTP